MSCKKLNKIVRNISFLDYKLKKKDFYEAMIKENLSENSNYEMQHSKKKKKLKNVKDLKKEEQTHLKNSHIKEKQKI